MKKTTIRTGEESFSDAEWQKLMTACNTLMDRIMLLLGISYGLRRQDMVRLQIQNINFENQEITYYEHKKDKFRTLPMSDKLAQELRIYIHSLGVSKGFLFPYGDSQWGDRSLWTRLNELCDRAKIPRRKFHSLRATCYKVRQKMGWTAQQSADLIGDTIEVAVLHYGTTSKGDLIELIQKKDVI